MTLGTDLGANTDSPARLRSRESGRDRLLGAANELFYAEGIHTVGELVGRSEQDLLDIRNFGAKSIEEVKQKLIDMGLALKDSPPGFDPSSAVGAYSDDDESYVETEQY